MGLEIKTLPSVGSNNLQDTYAFLHSYAVELKKDGELKLCIPCQNIPIERFTPINVFPEIDPTLELTLILWKPDTKGKEIKTRHPFFVKHIFIIGYFVGDQWWIFKFTPNKLYENRTLGD